MSIGRWLGVAIFSTYIILLVLAGWQPEIRPSLLDGAHDAALHWLAILGVRPGIAVFDDPRTDAGWKKTRFLCTQVAGTLPDGTREILYESDCSEDLKLWFPGEPLMLHGLIARASRIETEPAWQGHPLSPYRLHRNPLAALREHFRRRFEARHLAYDRYDVAVSDRRIDYRSGEESEHSLLHMIWRTRGDKVLVQWPLPEPDSNSALSDPPS